MENPEYPDDLEVTGLFRTELQPLHVIIIQVRYKYF